MEIVKMQCVSDCIDMCGAAWKLGWHEYHAGNISYRLTQEERSIVQAQAKRQGQWVSLSTQVPTLAGEYFLASAGGSSFRALENKPERDLGILEINGDGSAYRTLWGFENGRPTSELPAHLMNHEIKRQESGDRYRIIYHAHPTNLIALSFVLPLSDEVFTRELWEMEPECAMTFPGGIGVLPWITPASVESAIETGNKMREYDIVLWAYHGAFCAGETFEATLGLMHTVEKAAEMLVKVMSLGGKRQRPSVDNFNALKEPFGLNLPDRFLFER